ncbi:MAG: Multidrug resistance protein MdtH [Planctomycetota bacterium]|jgi:MFS family permease
MTQFREHMQRFVRGYASLPPVVHLLCVGSFINRVGSFVMLFLTIYVSEHLQMGKPFASACVGVFGLGSVLSAVFGGQLADTLGRRPAMLMALFGGATILASLSLITNGWLFMATLFLFALVVEMYRPASSAMIGDVVSPLQRPLAFGLLYLSFNLGFAIAPQIGGWLAARSYTFLFLADAATTGLYGIVVLLFIRETHHRSRSVVGTGVLEAAESTDAGATPVSAAEALAAAEEALEQAGNPDREGSAALESVSGSAEVSLGAALQCILRDANFLLFSLCCLLTNIVFMQAFVTLPLAIREQGFSELQFGRMISVNGLLIVLLQLPATPLLNRLPRLQVLICGQLLMAAGFGLTACADAVWQIVCTIVLWTLGEICQAPFKPAIVSEMAPAELRARYMGVFNVTHAASIAIGAPAGGWILSRFGPQVLWPGCAVVLLLTAGLYAWLFRRLEKMSGAGLRSSG